MIDSTGFVTTHRWPDVIYWQVQYRDGAFIKLQPIILYLFKIIALEKLVLFYGISTDLGALFEFGG
ncbi:hypothetical protein D3C71_1737410 [compost metagenome]